MKFHDRLDRMIFQFMKFNPKHLHSPFKKLSKSEFIAAVEEVGSISKQASDEGKDCDFCLNFIYTKSIFKLMECYISDKEISEVLYHTMVDTVRHVDKRGAAT